MPGRFMSYYGCVHELAFHSINIIIVQRYIGRKKTQKIICTIATIAYRPIPNLDKSNEHSNFVQKESVLELCSVKHF